MSAVQAWEAFLLHSLATRLEPETFNSYLDILSSQSPLHPTYISEILLRPSDYNSSSLDPRIPRYLQNLLARDLVKVPHILRSLRKYSTCVKRDKETRIESGQLEDGTLDVDRNEDVDVSKRLRWKSSYASEESIFYRLAKYINNGNGSDTTQEAVELLLVAIQWMQTVVIAQRRAHNLLNISATENHDINAQTVALAALVVAIVENTKVQQVLSKGKVPAATGKDLSNALEDFVPLFVQSSPQSSARLALFRTQTLPSILPTEKKTKEITASGEIDALIGDGLGVESVVIQDLPLLNSRPGLYIYLNALLVERPLIDDNSIFAYLHNRYQGDVRTSILDLILASFDILANATFRNEKAQDTSLVRSFLINKLPLLLAGLSASLFPPLTPEFCITEALNRVDTNLFPTLSNMFDETSSFKLFSDSVRQDFCFACSLHGLIAESHIETLLGDVPMQSLPAGGRYVKEDLVEQFISDSGKAARMVDELENMDGNVGAISQAIAETIGRLCAAKDTMSLHDLCGKLFRKSGSFDVMLLFNKPTTILQPICELLDSWRYDEDQGEYQPVYQEFGTILLLVLAFTYKYNLSAADLGIRNTDSFIAKLLFQNHHSRALDELTTQEQNNLSGWIRGLFDNESGGLGDELMSSCPPQDFYLLIPTLFHQVVLACSTKNLNDEALKGGLEYLVDMFLLPSLIPGITWLSLHLWESRGDANAVLQILTTLIINPSLSSTTTSEMITTCIKVVAKNLEHSLRYLQRAEPTRQDVEPLSKALRPHLGFERRGGSDHVELETWTATPGGGISVAIKQTLTNLVQWGLNPAINAHPTNYTHRQILVGSKILGAKRLLHIILEEVKTQTESGNGSVVLDVATALICAPDSTSWDGGDLISANQPLQRRLTLREALKDEAESAPKLHKSTQPGAALQAENIIRLYRKVEAQLLVPQQQALMAQDTLVTSLDEAIMAADVGLGGAGDDLGDPHGVGMGMDALGSVDGGMGGLDDDIMSGLMGDGAGSLFGGDGMSDSLGF